MALCYLRGCSYPRRVRGSVALLLALSVLGEMAGMDPSPSRGFVFFCDILRSDDGMAQCTDVRPLANRLPFQLLSSSAPYGDENIPPDGWRMTRVPSLPTAFPQC